MGRLPPGQVPAELSRFGLPRYARVHPRPPADPMINIGGVVRHPTQLRLGELLAAGDRRAQHSDLHCVTTWTAQGLLCRPLWRAFAPMVRERYR